MIIGREKEQTALLELLTQEEAQFCAVYGRRRVGKTFLIRETFGHHFAFQHTGLAHATRKDQLREFRMSLQAAGLRINRSPADWYEAFHALEDLLTSLPAGKKVIFLDELSWMDTQKSSFLNALEHFWNGWATARPEKDIVLIVCGSATSWLINNLVRNHGGLHNRLTCQLYIPPFTLSECSEYATAYRLNFSMIDIAEAYMILGGIPYYWSFFKKGESMIQGIDRMLFAENAPLAQEFQALYASLFKNYQGHIAVVTALARKKTGLTRKELLDLTHLPDNSSLTHILEELEQCSFICHYNAFGHKERDTLYQLMDNFTLFYFQFLENRQNDDDHYWTHTIDTPLHNAWAGLAFEHLCLWHLPQIKTALGISGVITQAYSWRAQATDEHDGAQIDLVIQRNDRVINLCEMKYASDKYSITKEEDAKLRHRMSLFIKVTKTKYAVHTTMITPFGVEPNSYRGTVLKEITLDDLMK